VFGSEGTIAGMGWQTYALRVGFSLFIFEGRETKNLSIYHLACSVTVLQPTVLGYEAVREFRRVSVSPETES